MTALAPAVLPPDHRPPTYHYMKTVEALLSRFLGAGDELNGAPLTYEEFIAECEWLADHLRRATERDPPSEPTATIWKNALGALEQAEAIAEVQMPRISDFHSRR
jgi:hypothetical protein